MKTNQIMSILFILFLVDVLAITFNILPSTVAAEDSPYTEFLDETGTHFELPSFNVSITTETTVHIMLYACSDRISYMIENASMASSTQLTLGTLKPLTTYYKYMDSLINENVFISDASGEYVYQQDLSRIHRVCIKPRPSTTYITTSTILHSDIYDEVVIAASNIVLDLNGYSIIGGGWWAWIGIDVSYAHDVTIKNGGVRNFDYGINSDQMSPNIAIINCTISASTFCDIYSHCNSNWIIRNNTISSSGYSAFEMSHVDQSLITENTFASNHRIALEVGWTSSGNKIYHNNFIGSRCWTDSQLNDWDNGYPSGGNYWTLYTGVDLYNGPGQNIAGSDGIGDSPYGISGLGTGIVDYDYYPLMNPWTPTETIVQIGGIDEPVTIVSNTAVSSVVANKNNLKFVSSGPTGQTGYVTMILPMSVVTTSIKVSIDNKKPASPFPIINNDGTYYFIYFEFTLSTHIVTVQFAPSIPAIVDIDPDTLNLKNEGQWITAYIEFTEEYSVDNIDVSTIMLNATFPAALYPTEVGDHNKNGIPDLMVKFNRTEVSQYICDVQGIKYGTVTLTIKGELYDKIIFEGSDSIKVRMPGDVNCDGEVDFKDVSLLAKTFGNRTYSSYLDINEDGAIDMKDVAMACKNFGKTYK